ncbi:MAG: alpha/beta fold hydrolase [Bacilli bacterium]|nr:alpha/beta fold hydrolase [Bacilli bacterium]
MSLEQIYLTILIIVGALLVFAALGGVVALWIVSGMVFRHQLVRGSKENWDHSCSDKTNYEQMIMWQRGQEWFKNQKGRVDQVEIKSEGLSLKGQYIDDGFDRAVIIVPGRTESYEYSYYFAPAFEKAKCNLLLIDVRGHGFSDGEYEDCGYRNYVDLIEWSKFIHEKYKINDITLFGICIGSNGCLNAITSPSCPPYVKRMISDGMFSTFRESFKNHLIALKRPVFLLLDFITLRARLSNKINICDGPVKRIKKMEKPILMIYTKEDLFSTPKDAKKIYANCPSKDKKIVFFDHGAHSHVRINAEEEYDKTIYDYLNN